MKKLIFALFAVALASPLCLAQEEPAVVNQETPAPATVQPQEKEMAPVAETKVAAETPAPETKVETTPVERYRVKVAPLVEAKETSGAKTVAGKLEFLSVANTAKGTNPEMVIIADNGQRIFFMIIPATTVTDKNNNTPGVLARGDKVIVEYTALKTGINVAISVKPAR